MGTDDVFAPPRAPPPSEPLHRETRPPGEFTVLGLLRAGGRLMRAHAGAVLGSSAVVGALAMLAQGGVGQDPGSPGRAWLASLVGSVLQIGGTSYLLRSFHRRETGATALDRTRDAAVDCLRLLLPDIGYELALVVGFAALVAPGLWLAARWALVWPVWVLERGTLSRAEELSLGRRRTLLAAWLLAQVGAFGAVGAIAAFVPGGLLLGDLVDFALFSWPTAVTYEAWLHLRGERATTHPPVAPPDRRQ